MATTRRRSTTRSRRRTRRAKAAPPIVRVPEAGERYWVLDVPYEERASARGAVWHPGYRTNLWVGARLPEHLHRYRSRSYSPERFVEDSLNDHQSTDREPPNPMSPRLLQVEGARAIARHAAANRPQFYCADDPGTGKTGTAIIGAKAAASLRKTRTVLVIADRPAEITIPHWRRSIAAFGDGGLTWVVTTWDRLAKTAGLADWGVVIADESHMVRHQTTARWKHYSRIVGLNRSSKKPYIITLTATPSHTPLEQGYLIPAYADRLGGSTKEWAGDWTGHLSAHGVHIEGTQWADDDRHRADDLKRVRGWLTDQSPPALIHRPAPWGPCPVSGLPVDLPPVARAAYEQEWGAFCAEMALARRGKDSAKGRAAIMRYRQKAGMIRISATVDWVLAQVEAERQVAVSVAFIETAAEPLVEMLSSKGVQVARIYGGVADPEAERLRFQTGTAPVVVFTTTASISLHAGEDLGHGRAASTLPRVGIFHQPRYSGIEGRQVVGRTHRDGMVSPWNVAYAADTVEEQAARTMIERYAAASEAVGGDTRALANVARLFGIDWLSPDTLTE